MLLVVRELLAGPRRFEDLLELGMVGIQDVSSLTILLRNSKKVWEFVAKTWRVVYINFCNGSVVHE
jgi:hypothetical protein